MIVVNGNDIHNTIESQLAFLVILIQLSNFIQYGETSNILIDRKIDT